MREGKVLYGVSYQRKARTADKIGLLSSFKFYKIYARVNDLKG